MSTPLSSLPVLRGREGTVLFAEDGGLVLDLPTEQVTFTADGLGRIRAEGRTVLIELRSRAGTTPLVHRIDDVDAEAAVRFADGINALLANRTDSDDVDGAPFAVIRSLRPTWRKTFHRRLLRGVLAYLLALVALIVIAAALGEGDLAVILIPLGGLSWLALWCGAYGAGRSRREKWLLTHGVTTTAVRATRGGYIYPDGTGAWRGLLHSRPEPSVPVAFPPDDPADVLVLSPPFTQLVNALAGVVLLFGGAALTLLTAVMTVLFLID
ncbi:hypothetical protein HHL19_02270 [Streptomyces sp. R302]|uniref:hypothetical protein n=1 Tax=unclassified Streptomyces TaxID=2593676 RepID=UPI00145CE83B|nr:MULTISPECIES: hypothetical protein [unclassified Streptomyces]NML49185.1 hypothetical protein [Streptomyces sp. R301]NML77512.1 hypothetical protein [Streptomyces sp. R302]